MCSFLKTLSDTSYVPPNFVNFSAQTGANQAQHLIDAKLDKRCKGVYGPPFGKVAIVFVDDLNMCTKEVYGAQPPIELLRQYMDHGGWYDRDNSFRQMKDVLFLTAMGLPGGAAQLADTSSTLRNPAFDLRSQCRAVSTFLENRIVAAGWKLIHPSCHQ